jgi:hypothetical protein
MSKKQLNTQSIANELEGASLFFVPPRAGARRKKTVDESPRLAKGVEPTELQTDRVTDSQSSRVPESETHRLTDFEDYDVPDYRDLQRIELRLTWEQNKYLDDLEAVISRDMPEGDRSDPSYKRITKNSIIRGVVEIFRRLELGIDASSFKSEQDLAKTMFEAFRTKILKLQTDRVTD